ncbi:MAG: universal stress protein [Nitrospiraceae bacterium]|nr:universal stress protein [Nitrospiraceae bacterium]
MAEICPVFSAERLLLATDASLHSEGAIREAIRLAKQCGSTLEAISVIETNPEYEALAPKSIEKAEKAAREHLDAVAGRAKSEGVSCSVAVLEGEDSYRSVVDEAVKQKTTMIVMGRRGRTGLKRLVMGSTTARVIGHAPCTVLVVPRAATVEFKSVVVATDGSRYSAAAASEAIGIAKRNGSKLTVVAVVPAEIATPTDVDFVADRRELIAEREMQEAEKNAKAVKEAAAKEQVNVKAFVMTGKPADAIMEAAKDANADLVVVGSHGRTGLEKLLMGSVAERVIVLASSAVLVVKGK